VAYEKIHRGEQTREEKGENFGLCGGGDLKRRGGGRFLLHVRKTRFYKGLESTGGREGKSS